MGDTTSPAYWRVVSVAGERRTRCAPAGLPNERAVVGGDTWRPPAAAGHSTAALPARCLRRDGACAGERRPHPLRPADPNAGARPMTSTSAARAFSDPSAHPPNRSLPHTPAHTPHTPAHTPPPHTPTEAHLNPAPPTTCKTIAYARRGRAPGHGSCAPHPRPESLILRPFDGNPGSRPAPASRGTRPPALPPPQRAGLLAQTPSLASTAQ